MGWNESGCLPGPPALTLPHRPQIWFAQSLFGLKEFSACVFFLDPVRRAEEERKKKKNLPMKGRPGQRPNWKRVNLKKKKIMNSISFCVIEDYTQYHTQILSVRLD